MHLPLLRHAVLVVAIGLTVGGCGEPSPDATPAAPASSQAAAAEKVTGPPAGWDDANRRSAEYYRTGNFPQKHSAESALLQLKSQLADLEATLAAG